MKYTMRYSRPAEDSDHGWESQALPVGNGYMGACVFGGVATERIQISEETFFKPPHCGGFTSFADIYIDTPHQAYTHYERGLSLDDAIAYCRYSSGSVDYTREVFASYPDRVLAINMQAAQAGSLNMRIRVVLPYVTGPKEEAEPGAQKSGAVVYRENAAYITGCLHGYNLRFEARMKVCCTGGTCSANSEGFKIVDANSVTILFIPLTSYVLESRVFLEAEDTQKTRPIDLTTRLDGLMQAAADFGYAQLRGRHVADYSSLFARVALNLGDAGSDAYTDALLHAYAKGAPSAYLEALYFQYGRYLLIASSRPGTLPANLQGVWTCHNNSPWGSGFWHNINVQMNYWPAFSTNLCETFQAYASFNEAFRAKACQLAADYIGKNNPESYDTAEGACGWTIGTASYPYMITGPGGHSGPGTGALTTKMFWDYYAFTQDRRVLKQICLPALEGMARFLTKTVRDYDGLYLADPSASPEQMINRTYLQGAAYYQTIGCAFDQQMLYENGHDYLLACEAAGVHGELADVQKHQLGRYHPVEIGLSGQVKEYAEEGLYGEIGEYDHRHISQLVGLYPGTIINSETPAWMDAARITLTHRGDESTGWALAHRLNAWARLRDGEHAHRLLKNLIGVRSMDNLWDLHPPFQIDGNFGGTAGIAEMLLQSHEGRLAILPCLPGAWKSGSFQGLLARGNFEVSVQWKDGVATTIQILAKSGGMCSVEYPMLCAAELWHNHMPVFFTTQATDIVSFATEKGETYCFTHIPVTSKTDAPANLRLEADGTLLWDACTNTRYHLYAAAGNDAQYTVLAKDITCGSFQDFSGLWEHNEHVTYRLTAQATNERESDGMLLVRNHKSRLEMARYRRNLSVAQKSGMGL